jgi:hypothetical protein
MRKTKKPGFVAAAIVQANGERKFMVLKIPFTKKAKLARFGVGKKIVTKFSKKSLG